MRTLDYHSPKQEIPRDGPPPKPWGCLVFAVIVLGIPAHLVGGAWADYQLFQLSGNVHTSGAWTCYGGDYAWANVAWIPAGVLSAVDDTGPGEKGHFALLWLALLLMGSIVASCFLGLAVHTAMSRGAERGRFGWRFWLFAVFWFGWIPVPIRMCLSYHFTIVY
jgi:hypothetical protein